MSALRRLLGPPDARAILLSAGDEALGASLVGLCEAHTQGAVGSDEVVDVNRVANLHSGQGEYLPLACGGFRDWDVLLDGSHSCLSVSGATTLGHDTSAMRTCGRSAGRATSSQPPANHLFRRGGSGCSPELARVSAAATTSTTYFQRTKGARRVVLYGRPVMGGPPQYDAKTSVAEVAVGSGSGCSPHRLWAAAATDHIGSTRHLAGRKRA